VNNLHTPEAHRRQMVTRQLDAIPWAAEARVRRKGMALAALAALPVVALIAFLVETM
jgi:hypothetical protein